MRFRHGLLPFVLLAALLLSACSFTSIRENVTEAAGTVSETVSNAVDVVTAGEAEAAPSGITSLESTPVPTAEPTPEPAVPAVNFTERGNNLSGDYTDEVGNLYHYTFSLPYVSGDSGYAGAVNVELDGIYETFIAPELKNMDGGLSLITTNVSWKTAEFNGITSLIVVLRNDWDNNAYYIYNFTSDGKKASNPDIFSALGITGDDFVAAAREEFSEYLSFNWLDESNEETAAYVREIREKTLDAGNCNDEMPVYVTEYGTVCFAGRAYSLAGAEYYDHLFILSPQGGFEAEELSVLGMDYYAMQAGIRPGYASFEDPGDGNVVIRLYESEADQSTALAVYTVSAENGSGTDGNGDPVDLTVQ